MSGNGQNNGGGGGAAPQNPPAVGNGGAQPRPGGGNFQNLPKKRGNDILKGIFTGKR